MNKTEEEVEALAAALERVSNIVDSLIEGASKDEMLSMLLDSFNEVNKDSKWPNEWWRSYANTYRNAEVEAWKIRALAAEEKLRKLTK